MPVPDSVAELIDRFERNLDDYRSSNYNEARLRQEFLNPFFKALGWDVDNERGYAEAYKDVVHEDSLKVEDSAKAPDYCFRIGGQRKFFVEAKKPSVNIHDDIAPAFQLRRYSWSAKLSLGILTDFEELAVYDTRVKPVKTDKASKARVKFLKYTDYTDRWDEIKEIFARDSILKGSFDQYSVSAKKKRGTALVDDEILKEIELWRESIARNIALRNPGLTNRDLNYAVQSTIDRIIFLRICEGRGIEKYGTIMSLQNGKNVHARLQELFHAADVRYNSGLFHFKDEKGRSEPDTLTPGLKIDDKILKDIIKRLYYPESPYEFAMIPPDILGQVYERFLGKVIRLTKGGQAKVEDKPEVRKAGGVYYTPTYIVDYIVEHTVGKLLKKWTPQARKKTLRVLDPACGSGSFLLGAYQYLLDWHLDYYQKKDPEKLAKKRNAPIYLDAKNEWKLTLSEKKRILTEHIYGVDIDTQAVEVTKLSLLLKVIEDENEENLSNQLRLLHERALPDLSDNIKCGNSLIGPDFYDNAQMTMLDDEEQYRINVFDWHSEFPDVFDGSNAGFDAVIGNPPYVRPHYITLQEKEYFWDTYSTFVKKADLYTCFIERGHNNLSNKGHFGYIVSNGWLRLDSFENLREYLLRNTTVKSLMEFTGRVFEQAHVNTVVLITEKVTPRQAKIDVSLVDPEPNLRIRESKVITQRLFENTYKHIFDTSITEEYEHVKTRIRELGKPLGDLFDLSFGLKTGDDDKFLTTDHRAKHAKPLLRGEDIHRYRQLHDKMYVIYDPKAMKLHRRTARPGTIDRFCQPKVLVRDTGGELEANFDDENYFVKDVLIVSDENKDSAVLKYLLGLINSNLLEFYYETSFPTLHVQRDELASLPTRPIDFSNPDDVKHHDRMVELVDSMLDLNKKLQSAKTPHEKQTLQRRIDATDSQIDRLVYELYELTEEEIRIVEG